jgi:hypothetical protein
LSRSNDNFKNVPLFSVMRFKFSFKVQLVLITLINLLQASFTGLLKDEAYYAYFSRDMQWGYFDHPPFVALLALPSNIEFMGLLGARILSVFSVSLSYGLLYQTLSKETQERASNGLFLLVLLGLPLVNLYGFLTLPDTGTLLFTALFFYAYKQFLSNSRYAMILLGLAMAGLMYSKYTGVLIIIGIIASNPSLIKDSRAWKSAILSLLLFAPHLFWLSQNEWMTLRFHFSERPNHAYEFLPFTGGFLLNAIAILGLYFFDFYRVLFTIAAKNSFNKGLKFTVWVILGFFFFSSFSKKSQLQWLLPAAYPILLLFIDRPLSAKESKRIKTLGVVSIMLIFSLRFLMTFEQISPIHLEPHGVKEWSAKISNKANGKPVLFIDSYQRAALYEFYSGEIGLSYNTLSYRPNQYDLDLRWKSINRDSIFVVSSKPYDFEERIESPKKGDLFWSATTYLNLVLPEEFEIDAGEIRFNRPLPGKLYLAQLDKFRRVQKINELKVEGATSAPLPEINPNYPFYRIGISSPELPPRIIHKFAQATGQ